MVEKMNGLSIELLSHPGETLKEVLESNNMSQKELAARIGLSTKHINQIVSGLASISPETAFKLEKVFSLSAKFWNNLQTKYDEEKMILLEETEVGEEEIAVYQSKIYNNLCNYGYLQKKSSIKSRIVQLRDFLGVSNLLNIDKMLHANALFRKSNVLQTNNFALATWMKICEIETDCVDNVAPSINVDLLASNIPEIKCLNLSHDPNTVVEKLRSIFAQCGVAFAVVRNIQGAPVQGFIRKINNKVRLCVTLRNKYSDIFWFTLFHEIGHLLNLKNEFFIDFSSSEQTLQEKIADEFAKGTLLNEQRYIEYCTKRLFTKDSIIRFAEINNVMPGIVVGRLQHDKLIPNSFFNDLRSQYIWSD